MTIFDLGYFEESGKSNNFQLPQRNVQDRKRYPFLTVLCLLGEAYGWSLGGGTEDVWITYRATLWKWKSLSCVSLFSMPWTVAHQAPLSVEFCRQEYWSGWPFPSPGDLPNPEIEPRSPTLKVDSLPSEPPGKPILLLVTQLCLTLCDPMDCSPPGSSVHGIFQARRLEWVAISFSRSLLLGKK